MRERYNISFKKLAITMKISGTVQERVDTSA